MLYAGFSQPFWLSCDSFSAADAASGFGIQMSVCIPVGLRSVTGTNSHHIRRAPHKTALGMILDPACMVWAQGAESSVSVQNPSDPAQKYISCLKSTSMALFDHIFQLPSSYFSVICTNRENFLVGILLPPFLPPHRILILCRSYFGHSCLQYFF